MRKKLSNDFFDRPVQTVARELLGKYLVRKVDGKPVAYKIVETEAYDGDGDMACHAARGKTARNAPMFEKAGTIYVYFTYGMHWMLNIVCRESGFPAAVLIRGVEGISGPARLTKALGIDKQLNGKTLGKNTGLWIEDLCEPSPKRISCTPRIGVDYAGKWAKKKWRFVLETNRPERSRMGDS